jgi:uncharacterized protein (TIGR03905 family)
MKDYSYQTTGTCSTQIDFSLDNGKIFNLKFHGGCPGNTNALSRLLQGSDARKAAEILKGNPCGSRGTSCADQLSKALEKALQE